MDVGRVAGTLACLGLMLFATTGQSEAQGRLTLTTKDRVALRARASQHAESVAVLQQGSALVPLGGTAGSEDSWYLVQTEDGIQGWLRASEVSESRQLEAAFARNRYQGPPSGSASIGGNGNSRTAIPIDLRGTAILVPVTLNGSLATRMIMDTGASLTVITRRLAKRLGLQLGSRISLMTANGNVSAPLSRVTSLRVGNAERRNLTVVVHDFAQNQRIGGLLGMNFFKEYQTSVDARKGQLTLIPR